MTQPRPIFVTGATGKQGGSVARELLRRGHRVRALTRNADSGAARALAEAGAQLVKGDFGHAESLLAELAASDVLFLMGTPYGTSTEDEVKEAVAMIDVACRASVRHIVYSSVAGAAHPTGVPHFESKRAVESHLAQATDRYTICAPVAFMDFSNAMFLTDLRRGELRMGLPPARILQYISLSDIGSFVANLIGRDSAVFGRRYEIAGDEHSGEQVADILSRVSDTSIRYVSLPIDAIRAYNEDFAAMFDWLNRVGYGVDRSALRREFPDMRWQSLEEWARQHDWKALLASRSEREGPAPVSAS